MQLLVKFTKYAHPKDYIDFHALIGWAFNAPIEMFTKEMACVRSFNLRMQDGLVQAELIALMPAYVTESSLQDWLKAEWLSRSYLLERRSYSWDAAQVLRRVGEQTEGQDED